MLTHSSILATSLCPLSPANIQHYLWFPKSFPPCFILTGEKIRGLSGSSLI